MTVSLYVVRRHKLRLSFWQVRSKVLAGANVVARSIGTMVLFLLGCLAAFEALVDASAVTSESQRVKAQASKKIAIKKKGKEGSTPTKANAASMRPLFAAAHAAGLCSKPLSLARLVRFMRAP